MRTPGSRTARRNPAKKASSAFKKRSVANRVNATSRRSKLAAESANNSNLKPILDEILDAAIHISGADLASIQLIDPISSKLRIVATVGLPQVWVDFWNRNTQERCACGVSLRRRKRVIVEDVEQGPMFKGASLKIQLKVGIRAVQSTPIFSRSRKPLGVFSTYYKGPHRPDERTLRLLDLLAGQAADIIEYGRAKAALRATEERLKRILETHAIAVLFWDHTGTLIGANDAFLRMTGYSQADVQRRKLTWRNLTPPEWIESSEQQWGRLAATGHIGPYEKEYFLKDGSRRWMMFVGRDLGDRTLVEYCLDITDRKRMEEEREREGRRKDEFLSLLSHELRNPLTAISLATRMLRSGVTAERRASLDETIARQVGMLERLVNDLLDLARITHGQISLKKESTDLADFLQQAAGSARPFLEDRGQKLVLHLPSERVSFMADGMRLEQIATNLLNNASNYTDRGGRIEFSGAREDSDVVIRCKDNGRGVPIEMQEKIFEPFTRGPLSGDSHGEANLGIGLALVRKLAELHDGWAWMESAGPGKGSKFTVRLPLVKALAARHPRSTVVPSPGARRHLSIAIVEDNPDVAQTMTIALEQAGHKVAHFADGLSALSGFSELQPDAALIDIGLPGMDGYELAANLRKKRNLRQTLFIAVSGFKKRPENGKSKPCFDHYLVKPVTVANLLTLLDRCPRARKAAATRPAKT